MQKGHGGSIDETVTSTPVPIRHRQKPWAAGSLGIRLAGDASYFGKTVNKPTLGDATRAIVYEDILRMNRLAYGAAVFCLLLCLGIMGLILAF